MTTLALRYHAIHKRLASAQVSRIPFKLILAAASVCCMALLAFYVVQVNALTKGVYLIGTDDKAIADLSSQNAMLQSHFAKAGFLGQVSQEAQAMGFVKTQNIVYVTLPQQAVAVR